MIASIMKPVTTFAFFDFSAQKLMGKLVKEDRWHLVSRGNVRCLWRPSEEGAIFTVLDAATVLNGVAGLDTR
jgi:hypothetical protein